MRDLLKLSPNVRVVRLAPWLLEVISERPDRPWDQWESSHNKRRDAEAAARQKEKAGA